MKSVSRRLAGRDGPDGPAVRWIAFLAVVAALLGVLVAATAAGRNTLVMVSADLLVVSVLAVSLRIHRSQQVFVRRARRLATENAGRADRAEKAQQRMLAVVEAERLAADKRQRALITTVERQTHKVTRLLRDQTREIEALLQLFGNVSPRAPMPPSGHWAVNASSLLDLLHLIERKRPKTVLELGSGTSTVWIAYSLEKFGGRLISVDHKTEYAEQTRYWLSTHGLQATAEVRMAPLEPITISGEEFQWYSPEAFTDLSDVDLLLVDGPPGATCPLARFPALHALEDKLSGEAVVVLDDAERPDEAETVRRWLEAAEGLSRANEILGAHAVLSYNRSLVRNQERV